MRISGKILVGVAVAVVAVLLAKNAIIKSVASASIRKSTGFELELKKINAGLFRQSFEIVGLKLTNPKDFPDPEAFDVQRLYVHYDLLSFLSSTVHIHEVVIEIPQVVMVKKEDGETNLERMKQTASTKRDEGEPTETPETEEPKPDEKTVAKKKQQIMIDVLTIRLGKVEIRDYARARDGKPKVTTYDLGVDRTFRRVGSVRAIVNQITNQVLIEGGVKAVADKLRESEKSGKLKEELNKMAEKLGRSFKKTKETE